MAQPAILGEGTTPYPGDTRWVELVKIVGAAYNNATSPDPANAPKSHDTRWELLRKLNSILAG